MPAHKKTHCIRGHEFTPENTYTDVRGARICRACKREWARENTGLKGRLKNNKNQNTGKTHCIRGHEFTAENTCMKGTHRICIICRNSAARISARIAEAKYSALQKADPVRWAAERRRRRAEQLKRIGWSLELFDKKWEEQKGKCAICKRELNLEVKHNENKAHADHAHVEPPKPREILCGNCNLGIGLLMENLETMRAAIAYVEKWKD